jgi:tetratricopeptide (TPR) repeat protein
MVLYPFTSLASLVALLMIPAIALPALAQVETKSIHAQANEPSSNSDLVAQIDEIARQITVRIDSTKSGNGSGVIIATQDNTYYVLTAAHVVQNPDSYTLVAPDGQEYPVNTTATTLLKGADLAIVAFNSSQTYQIATLGDYDSNKAPTIFVSGFPAAKSDSKTPSQRRLTAGANWSSSEAEFMVKDAYSLTNGYRLTYSNLSYRGMSGGPVLDPLGRVIGINAAAENELEIDRNGEVVELNLGYSLGVPIETFFSLLKQTKIKSQWLKIATSPPRDLTQAELSTIVDKLLIIPAPSETANEIDWLNYGNTLWRAFQSQQAILAFDRAIQIKPDFYLAYYAKGLAYAYAGKYQEAATNFKKATKIQADFYPAWRWLGNSYYLSQQYPKALPAYDRAIALQPEDFVLQIEKGDVLMELQRFQEALAAYNKAVEMKPHSWCYHNRGIAYAKLQQPQLAIADFNKTLELQPDDSKAYYNLGITYRDLQEYERDRKFRARDRTSTRLS